MDELKRLKRAKQFQEVKDSFKDGFLLLRALEEIEPNIIDWTQVNSKCSNKFKCIENCNVFIASAKAADFHLANIGGMDIVNENRKLVSAVIWQMIRRMLGNMFDGGQNIGYGATSEMIEWANNMVTYRHEQILDSGKEHYLVQVDGYNDPKLANGHFLLELLDAVCPGCVFWQAVKTWKLENGDINTQGLISNAQTVIRTMKQIGCILVFFDVEDIICVDEMWIVSMFGSILHRYRNGASDNMASAALAEKQQAERAALRIQAQWRKKKGTFAKHLKKTAQKFASMGGEWYYLNKQNETVGPFFTEEMRKYCSQGIITADMLVVESEGKWVAAETTSWFSNADTVKNRMNLFGGGHREAERPRLPTDRVGEIWIQTTDDDGDTYYYNEDNGETLWEFPSGQPSVRKYDEDGTTRFYDYDTNTFY
jgi:plastin-1